MINLYPLGEFRLPITAECISPDMFQNKKPEEIRMLKVWEGNKQKNLGELFKVEESSGEETSIMIAGNVSKTRRVGACMIGGQITINGDAGMHLGEEMRAGKIVVVGNVGGWAGSMMKGGEIEIHGNASDYLGAPYRGSNDGISSGRIIVHGNVGNEAGAHMKKGTLKIYGNAGQFIGFRMRDGTIYVQGNCQARTGACMTGGKIVVSGALESVLPTFTIDGIRPKVKIDEGETANGPLYVFRGDIAEDGNGKLYVSKEKNKHLSYHERFL
jgi:formylmethanofuran dehydrogenase subunit C